jgi:hypothetical protein
MFSRLSDDILNKKDESMNRTAYIGIIFLMLPLLWMSGQEDGSSEENPLPEGFRTIQLGMNMEAVQTELKRDSYFAYRGEPDVSFLPQQEQKVIESKGRTFISRALFQFHENRLYIIILMLNAANMDYYTMYSTLTNKYGVPQELNPQRSIWYNESRQISLERPLTVKYIDRITFNELKEAGDMEESLAEISRENFLNEF